MKIKYEIFGTDSKSGYSLLWDDKAKPKILRYAEVLHVEKGT